MDTVRVKWNGRRRFVGWDEAGHGLVMDATREGGGDGSGLRPIELVLYALAGCTAMDVISILEKKRETVTDLELAVRGTQRESDYPHSYVRIEVEYRVTGVGVKPESVARAVELSEEKYCSVKGMFGPQVQVSTSFSVHEAEL
ncbi:MAG: OsmC family peroxiredoxin [Actinobacteria bacterium]|nr:OsmC family peroxiredoxin [Actinomycetota bacterium]